jgi:hypothetical protein
LGTSRRFEWHIEIGISMAHPGIGGWEEGVIADADVAVGLGPVI